jgi:ribosomal-protein-alanine N-acetyltransferase
VTAHVVWRADAAQSEIVRRIEKTSFGERSWGEKGVADSFVAPGAEVLLGGSSNNKPEGFAIWRASPGEAEVLAVGVVPAARGGGLGGALLGEIIVRARRAGATALYLEVDVGNAAAIGLYVGAGFVEAGRRKAYYRDGADALIMRKSL